MDLDDIFKASRAFSTHLHATHKAARDFHTEMIAAHEAELSAGRNTIFHKAAIAGHKKMLRHHAAQIAECEKAIDVTDLSKLAALAVGLGAITSSIPVGAARPSWQNPISVEGPRFTMPAPQKSNVPPEFEHLVKSE